MSRRWKNAAELAAALKARAEAGRTATLSPDTALYVAQVLNPGRSPQDRWNIDLYSQGSTVYRLDGDGEIFEVVAFAKNTLIARAAFDALCQHYPKDSFSQRRRGWVENDRIADPGVVSQDE